MNEKKFRHQYYVKVGFRDLGEKSPVEELLRETPLNEKKLASYSQQSVIPGQYRPLVWKLLLGITPRYAESQYYVRQQQTLMFEDLWRTLKVLRLRSPVDVHNGEFVSRSDDSNEHMSDSVNPQPEHYLLMWLISEARLLHNPRSQLQTHEHQRFILIAHRSSALFDDPVDLFQVFSALWSLLTKNQHLILSSVQDAIALLRKENDTLHLHLLRVGLFSTSILDDHCLGLFCDVFPETAVEKILDKVISGAFQILSFVTVALLCKLQRMLLSVNSVEGVRNCILQLRKEEADVVIKHALDHWHKVIASKTS